MGTQDRDPSAAEGEGDKATSKTANASQVFAAKKRLRFLDALATCGNVTASAKMVGVTPRRLYQVRAVDKDFAAAWDECVELGAQALEDEARRRAFDGVEKPLTSAKGLIYRPDGSEATVREYSDTLLIFLLKGARPQKYRERGVTEHTGSVSIKITRRPPDTHGEEAAS